MVALMVAGTNSSRSGEELGIPVTVRIGVTGHRTLVNEELLRGRVRRVLVRLDEILCHTPHTFTMLSPLAEGSDRLVAGEVLRWPVAEGVDKPKLEVVLPLPEADYLQDFETKKSKDEFKRFLARAESVQTLGKAESRTAAYEQVGCFVVQNCDLLIAIWNGKPAAGQGGTAEIVDYARKIGRSIFWINSVTGKLKEERHEDGTLESLKQLNRRYKK